MIAKNRQLPIRIEHVQCLEIGASTRSLNNVALRQEHRQYSMQYSIIEMASYPLGPHRVRNLCRETQSRRLGA